MYDSGKYVLIIAESEEKGKKMSVLDEEGVRWESYSYF